MTTTLATPTESPTTEVSPARPDTRAWLGGRISTDAAALVGMTWYVLFAIGTALEPETAAAVPVLSVVLGVAMLATLAVTAAGLLARRRWGLVASLGAAGLLTALTVACPASSHHSLAAWWFGQLACALGLVGASAYALRRA
jgi:hypothetical protein